MHGYLSANVIGSEMCALRNRVNKKTNTQAYFKSAPNVGSSFPSNIFEAHGKNVYEQLTVFCMGCNLFSVLWYDFMNKQTHPIFCNSR